MNLDVETYEPKNSDTNLRFSRNVSDGFISFCGRLLRTGTVSAAKRNQIQSYRDLMRNSA